MDALVGALVGALHLPFDRANGGSNSFGSGGEGGEGRWSREAPARETVKQRNQGKIKETSEGEAKVNLRED